MVWPPGSAFGRHCAAQPRSNPENGRRPAPVFWYSEPSFSAGIEVVKIDGVPVRIYSPEKTIADCFEYRNKIGLDVAIEALRTYRKHKRKPDLQSLTKFAQINRVQRVMRQNLESIL